jgi:pimeloyl-ACP methyl ester carboxylesterase
MPKLLRGPRLRASAPSRPPAARMDDGLLVTIRGLDQWIALPGDSPANPALLVVTGPGAAFSPMAPVFTPWEADFTLVHWDQPNAGATYARGGWTGPFTRDRLAADGIAVAEWVRARLGVPLALFCVSGGTAVGLMMVRARPELFAAYVGNGQIVDRARQETASYAAVLADARAAGDATAAALEAIGPPPWSDLASEVVKSSYANVLTPAERAAFAALPPGAMGPPPAGAAYVPHGLPVQDARAQATAAYAAIRSELFAFDARALGLDYALPMVLLQAAEDRHTTSPEVEAWAAELRAPSVTYVPIPGAGHMSTFLVDQLAALLAQYVRPLCLKA